VKNVKSGSQRKINTIKKDIKMNKEKAIIIILCFLLLFIGLFLTLGFKDGKDCMSNPFIYGANKITNNDTGNLYCTCSFASFEYFNFYFDNEEVEVLGG